MTAVFNHVVLLNRLVSKSIATVREHSPPVLEGGYLLDLIQNQFRLKRAIEFQSGDEDLSEEQRLANPEDADYVAISDLKKEETSSFTYFTMLIETANGQEKVFPVVDRRTRVGRELAGRETECAAAAALVVVRIPARGTYDNGEYRCAIEYSPYVRRLEVEKFLCRQLRRLAAAENWTFATPRTGKRGQQLKDAEYRYHPKLELEADVGRKLGSGDTGRQISHLVFRKRMTKEETAGPTHVKDLEPFLADVEIKVSAKQAQGTEAEKRNWLQKLKDYYQSIGYTTKIHYRYAGGGSLSGDLDKAVSGAIDLVMCPKEYVEQRAERPRWCPAIDTDFAERMKALLNDDGLWQRAQQS